MPGLPPIQGSTRTWAQSFKVWAVVSPYRQRNAGASKPLAIGGRGGNAAAMVLSVNGLRFASELSAVAALRELYKIPSGRSTDCFFKIIALLLLFGNSLHFGGEVFGYLFLLFLLFCFIGFYLLCSGSLLGILILYGGYLLEGMCSLRWILAVQILPYTLGYAKLLLVGFLS